MIGAAAHLMDYQLLAPETIWPKFGNEPSQSPPATSEWLRQMRSRARILANARQLVAEQGYDRFVMRDLAERSGITPPTIYHLIGNRASVLREAIIEGQTAKVNFATKLARKTGRNPILAYVGTILSALSHHQNYSRHSIAAIIHPKTDFELPRQIMERSRIAMLSWLIELEQSGRITRKVCLYTVANLVSRPIGIAVARWADDELMIEELMHDLALAVGCILTSLSHKSRVTEIEQWMETMVNARFNDQ